MALRFDNKVAVITGAGGGLGRAYALLLSSLGAKIVVNDLGGSLQGSTSGNTRAADVVVQEIKSKGGVAVANYDSVEFGQKIIDTAIQSFGRVDILINNAGILRDKSMIKMTEQDWDLIMLVHLKGAFSCTKAAWPHMRKQGYGRILNTASAAGLYGNFGQANYSAAKIGLVGFTQSIAAEGASKNIFSNVIVPIAGTRMTETILPKEIVDALRPEYIAPIVAFLCHESCKDNGSILECGAGWVAKLRWQRTQGVLFPKGFSPSDVQRDWATITDFAKGVTYPSSLQESLEMMMQNLEPQSTGPTPNKGSSSGTAGEFSNAQTKAEKIFALMGTYLALNGGEEGAKLVKKVNAKLFWNIAGDDKQVTLYTIDLKNGSGRVSKGQEGSSDCKFTISEGNFVDICLGKLNPQKAFLMGKMKVAGNMAVATKFTPDLFPKITDDLLSLDINQALATYLGGSSSQVSQSNASEPQATASKRLTNASDVTGTGLKSEGLINFMKKHLTSPAGQGLSKQVGFCYQFDVLPAKGKAPISFTIDLKSTTPVLAQGVPEKSDAVFTMLDDDFIKVVTGKLNPQIAFVQGKMKIKGNMKAAMKFTPDLFPKVSSL